MVRELFRDQDATEFIIATIPTVLGINESARLLTALRRERIPCKRIIVNQAPLPAVLICWLYPIAMRQRPGSRVRNVSSTSATWLCVIFLRAAVN